MNGAYDSCTLVKTQKSSRSVLTSAAMTHSGLGKELVHDDVCVTSVFIHSHHKPRQFRKFAKHNWLLEMPESRLTLSLGKGTLLWLESGLSPTGSCFKDLVPCQFDYLGETVELWDVGH